MKIPSLVRTGLIGLKTVYALIDAEGRIVEHDPMFPAWVSAGQENLAGQPLLDVLPEFVGQEEALAEVARREQPYLRVENVGHAGPDGEMRYISLIAVPGQPETGIALMVLVSDVTEQGHYLQELTQNRNELRLIRRKLAQLTDQLDYLFRHYVPAGVADALLEGRLRPVLGGELHPISILFADVRGFTTIAETMAPDRLMQLLNRYMNVIADAINERDGTISQFQGDNLLAIFNAPVHQPDHAFRAVQAGIAAQQAVAAYHTQHPPDDPRLQFGVGINTGPALVGNLGAKWRYSYTAIGDTVNLAARITGAVPAGEVWISEATQAELPETVPLEPLPPMTFKGKTGSSPLYRVCFNLPAAG